MINFTNKTYTTYRRKRNAEDDEDFVGSDKHLGYYTIPSTAKCLRIPIDEGVKNAYYYRQVAAAIADCGPNDQVEFEIASPGGLLEGLVALLTSLAKTEATSVAHINGECHSAASILALNCDVVMVSPFATMLVHFVQFGASGKSTDVRSQVDHIHSTSEALFRDTYKYFLTEEEMQLCINGLELWLSSEDIRKRLQRKFKLMKEDAENKSKPKTRKARAPKVISE